LGSWTAAPGQPLGYADLKDIRARVTPTHCRPTAPGRGGRHRGRTRCAGPLTRAVGDPSGHTEGSLRYASERPESAASLDCKRHEAVVMLSGEGAGRRRRRAGGEKPKGLISGELEQIILLTKWKLLETRGRAESNHRVDRTTTWRSIVRHKSSLMSHECNRCTNGHAGFRSVVVRMSPFAATARVVNPKTTIAQSRRKLICNFI
jgi:hypothetical protein